MGTILYINGEFCSNLEQLKGYFFNNLSVDSDIYIDLLESGRSGDMSKWLKEHGENTLAERVDSIKCDDSDTGYISELAKVLTDRNLDLEIYSFTKCFGIENVDCRMQGDEVIVSCVIKVLCVINENYIVKIANGWGTKCFEINPTEYEEGTVFELRTAMKKNPNKAIGKTSIESDGNVLKSIEPPIGIGFYSIETVTIITVRFPKIYDLKYCEYNDGLILVKDIKSQLFGFINEDCEEVLPCAYKKAHPFSGESAWVKKDAKSSWIIIDKKGKVKQRVGESTETLFYRGEYLKLYSGSVFSQKGEYIGSDSKSEKYYVNEEGVIHERNGHRKLLYKNLSPFYEVKDFVIKEENGMFGIMNRVTGKVYIPCLYKQIYNIGQYHYLLEQDNGKVYMAIIRGL